MKLDNKGVQECINKLRGEKNIDAEIEIDKDESNGVITENSGEENFEEVEDVVDEIELVMELNKLGHEESMLTQSM